MPNKNDCCVLKCLIRAGAPKAAIKKYTNNNLKRNNYRGNNSGPKANNAKANANANANALMLKLKLMLMLKLMLN